MPSLRVRDNSDDISLSSGDASIAFPTHEPFWHLRMQTKLILQTQISSVDDDDDYRNNKEDNNDVIIDDYDHNDGVMLDTETY